MVQRKNECSRGLHARGPLTILFLLCSLFTYAQERVITGTVTEGEGREMVGVNILVKGTNSGTVSDANGHFAIRIPGDSVTIVFSFVGYKTCERRVLNVSRLDVEMEQSIKVLHELVLIGYGIQEKKDVTGSVSVVRGETANAIPTANLENNLQGRVPGITVMTTGEPGSSARVMIRGVSTFAGSSQPLYVVDGVSTLDISTLNPSDVETISVLKDGGAASIYGSRAANGVVLITTKKGHNGGLKLTYSGYYGVQLPGDGFADMLDAQETADLTWLAFRNSGLTPPADLYGSGTKPVLPDYYFPAGKFEGDPDIGEYNAMTNPVTRANKKGTNWYDEVTRVAPIQNHDVAISGGGDHSSFYVGFNYFDQDGIVVFTGTTKYSMRVNTEFEIADRLRIGENITNTYLTSSNWGNGNFGHSVALQVAYITPGILPVYDEGGNYSRFGNMQINPYGLQAQTKDNHSFGVRTFGNVYAELDVLPGLTFHTSFGGSLSYNYEHWFNYGNGIGDNSLAEFSKYAGDWNWHNTLTFERQFGLHELQVLVGTEAITTDLGRSLRGQRFGYDSTDPDYLMLDNGIPAGQLSNGWVSTPAALLGYFSRIDYNFHDRYLANFTIRRDGSSKFIRNRFGTFPSATVGWRMSEENFMQAFRVVNELKVRAGYGIMGDQMNALPQNPYTTLAKISYNTYYDIAGSNSSSAAGFAINFYGNPDGQWQENKTANAGVDFSLFENKLSGSIDVYRKITDKLLYQGVLPASGGVTPPAARNVGEMENRGVDLLISYQQSVGKNAKLQADMTFTSYRNTVKSISNNVPYMDPFIPWLRAFPIRNQPGNAISSFYGYQVIGLWQNNDKIDTSYQATAAPGRFHYADVNGDSIINQFDRTVIGNPNPDFTIGLNLSLTYKNFDLSLFLYAVQGKDIYNAVRRNTDFFSSFFGSGARINGLLYESWTPERPDAKIPIAETESFLSTNAEINSYFVEDGSYLRLRNIQLGYTLHGRAVQKVRLYVQAVNLLTFTKYSGLDPEIGGTYNAFGLDMINYPATRQFIIGVNMEF